MGNDAARLDETAPAAAGSAVEVREVVGVFADGDAFQRAVDDLLMSGFSDGDLSILAGEKAVEEKLGHRIRRVSEVEDDPDVPRAEYVAPESVGNAQGGLIGGLTYVGATAAAGAIVATGGTALAAIIAAAVAGGAGGLIGTGLARWLGHKRADYLQEQLDRGGLVLWVRTANPDRERRAVEIMQRNAGRDVHAHAVAEGE